MFQPFCWINGIIFIFVNCTLLYFNDIHTFWRSAVQHYITSNCVFAVNKKAIILLLITFPVLADF